MLEDYWDQLQARKKRLHLNETENLGDGRLRIKLSQGKFAIIDIDDYEKIMPFRWFANRGRSTFYAMSSIYLTNKSSLNFRMHNLLIVGHHIDHKDGNGLNNSRSNIRICTPSQNGMNRTKKKNCLSIYKGVTWDCCRNKWVSFIQFNKKRKTIGYFESEIDAAKSYNEKAMVLFGEFAKLNNV